MRTKTITAVGLAALALGACIESTLPMADEIITGAVEGQVVDEAGVGVEDAGVSILLTTQPVSGTSRLLSQVNFVAGAQGRFVVTFQVNDEDPQIALASLSVAPPPARGLASADTLGIPVRLWGGAVAQDSAFVLITLPPR